MCTHNQQQQHRQQQKRWTKSCYYISAYVFFIVQKVLFHFHEFLEKYGCGCNPAGILMMTGDNIWEGIFTWWDDPTIIVT